MAFVSDTTLSPPSKTPSPSASYTISKLLRSPLVADPAMSTTSPVKSKLPEAGVSVNPNSTALAVPAATLPAAGELACRLIVTAEVIVCAPPAVVEPSLVAEANVTLAVVSAATLTVLPAAAAASMSAVMKT